MSDPLENNPDVEEVVPGDEPAPAGDARVSEGAGEDGQSSTAESGSEEPSLQEHHDPTTTEDTASGGAPEP